MEKNVLLPAEYIEPPIIIQWDGTYDGFCSIKNILSYAKGRLQLRYSESIEEDRHIIAKLNDKEFSMAKDAYLMVAFPNDIMVDTTPEVAKLHNFKLRSFKEEDVKKPTKNKVQIKLADVFTSSPGYRNKKEGAFSGEEFRKEHLIPLLRENATVLIDLDGTTFGYAVCFLEEAFGGLIRDNIDTAKNLKKRLGFISVEEPQLINDISNYIAFAEGEKRALIS